MKPRFISTQLTRFLKEAEKAYQDKTENWGHTEEDEEVWCLYWQEVLPKRA